HPRPSFTTLLISSIYLPPRSTLPYTTLFRSCLRRRHAPALSRRDILAKRRLYDPLYRRGGKRPKNHFEDCLKDERRRFISSRVSFRYVPGERPLRVIKAKRVRIKWRTGWPTASHIRRTIRFRPSRMTSSRTVRSFPRRIRRTWAGAVRPSSSRTPRLSRSSASSEGSPWTVAR